MKIPLYEAAEAAHARGASLGSLPPSAPVATDTRTMAPGDLFVALRGERFDGHAYAAEALARGACAVVVSDRTCVPPGAPAFVVDDTLAAYQAFGALARNLLGARVAAITGSAGKTTTKELTAQLIDAAGLGPVAATPANENNEIGVPKLFLNAPAASRAVVVEMGCRHYGDIAPLVAIARPDVAVLTNVGEAHLEIMGSRERLAETKFGIFASGAQAVLNRGDAVSRERAASLAHEPVWFRVAREDDGAPLPEAARELTVRGRVELIVREHGTVRRLPMRCEIPGDHNVINVAAAAAAAWAIGADPEALALAARSLRLPAGRYERRKIGDVELIYDAYNASPSGVAATLVSFSAEPARRKIVVLGSMAELGPEAPEMHRGAGALAATCGADALLFGGDFARELAAGARAAGFPEDRIVRFSDNDAAFTWLRARLRAGDLVLLKASRRYKLEEIVRELEAAHA